MRKLQLLLFIGIFCYSCIDKQKKQEKTDLTTIKTDTANSDIDNKEKEIIKKVSLSFYDWYIKTTKSVNDSSLSFIIVEGENGKCKVDFKPYFEQLRQLKTISKKFMDKEIERNQTCIDHMKEVDWAEYKHSDAYEYEDFCPDCSYMYWIQSQDTFDGVEILHMKKENDIWFTTLQLYNDYDNKRTREDSFFPIIKIENENGKWMMTEITLKRNK